MLSHGARRPGDGTSDFWGCWCPLFAQTRGGPLPERLTGSGLARGGGGVWMEERRGGGEDERTRAVSRDWALWPTCSPAVEGSNNRQRNGGGRPGWTWKRDAQKRPEASVGPLALAALVLQSSPSVGIQDGRAADISHGRRGAPPATSTAGESSVDA